LLTTQQIAYFQAFGFLVLRNVFSSAEANAIGREYDEVWNEGTGDQAFAGEQTDSQMTFCERRASLTKLAEDDRIYGPVEQLLGPNIIWGWSGAARYVGDSFWHKDDYDGVREGHGVIKVVMYFEPVGREDGCLRIIPGSHRPSFKQALRPLDEQHDDPSARPFGVAGPDIPGHAMETRPNDLIIFDSTAYHGAFGGRTGRSNLQLLYFPHPADDAELDTLRQVHNKTEYTLRVPEDFLNSDSPRLRGMVSPLVDWGFETQALHLVSP
jgi:ectoine hydroxylase-related dioxygenase (phytanoyl-CoA dioxygenase family)